MEKGILYWISGLSGSGKTTIGNQFYYQLKLHKPNTVILDEDILKNIAGAVPACDRNKRLEQVYRYSALCKLLTDQGMNVIICGIDMFDEIWAWNRENIDYYVEIFLDVDLKVLEKRNQKRTYDSNEGKIEVEYPKNPDIIIKNEEREAIREGVEKIFQYQVIPREKWNRDREYWNGYYLNGGAKRMAVNRACLRGLCFKNI